MIILNDNEKSSIPMSYLKLNKVDGTWWELVLCLNSYCLMLHKQETTCMCFLDCGCHVWLVFIMVYHTNYSKNFCLFRTWSKAFDSAIMTPLPYAVNKNSGDEQRYVNCLLSLLFPSSNFVSLLPWSQTIPSHIIPLYSWTWIYFCRQ
jgi:hypothetical protein